jgi:hypothetical protein
VGGNYSTPVKRGQFRSLRLAAAFVEFSYCTRRLKVIEALLHDTLILHIAAQQIGQTTSFRLHRTSATGTVLPVYATHWCILFHRSSLRSDNREKRYAKYKMLWSSFTRARPSNAETAFSLLSIDTSRAVIKDGNFSWQMG